MRMTIFKVGRVFFKEVRPVDKQILVDYIDACKVVDDTKEEIRKLKRIRKIMR